MRQRDKRIGQHVSRHRLGNILDDLPGPSPQSHPATKDAAHVAEHLAPVLVQGDARFAIDEMSAAREFYQHHVAAPEERHPPYRDRFFVALEDVHQRIAAGVPKSHYPLIGTAPAPNIIHAFRKTEIETVALRG